MSDDLVKLAREALDGVTPGPWEADNGEGYSPNAVKVLRPFNKYPATVAHANGDIAQAEANARFIAAARDLVPAMADRIEDLERACKEWAEISQRNYQLAKRYHKALKYINEPRFGLQSIIEDYGQDTNSYNYHASIYYGRLVHEYQKVAREAIAGVEGFEEVLQDFAQQQHRDAELDAIIKANIEQLYEP